ncbi:TIGR03085 family metal-binding protein [Brevibacterium paucivorans]|uniref:TIGR03085 family protein n=1 Tax=Brevibacterium paucivorans TaxID=170994 RepID=A0A2N6VMW1_9MICO|nr:TIGR03085 family metal-binding protein [Brevibacterium paucivorans]PMD05358.1 TIGR03085 family protein [Brevibacterium paucivorans]
MTNFARAERLSVAALLREIGPDAPTLCEGWTTLDLAVHLVIRDRYPAALPANASDKAGKVEFFAKRTAMRESELKALPWEKLVGMVAAGPGVLSPMGWTPVDVLTNTGEFYVHHEDIRRARKGWEPRNILPELEAQLWNVCKPLAHSPSVRNVGPLIVRAPGYGELHVGNTDEGAAVLEGKPSELVMYLFGRKDHAQVSLRS